MIKILLLILAFHDCLISASSLSFQLEKKPEPTPAEADAYNGIEGAMEAAVARYNRFVKLEVEKQLKVEYSPTVETARSNHDLGVIQFGPNSEYWTERQALHEIAHTLGVGFRAFNERCENKTWYNATSVLRQLSKDPQAEITCGGQHFWPYGMNYEKEFSEENADIHCQIIQEMIYDGMK
ncbi:uncharacterized protein MELLADRAFT_64159 [Melampsora larici-populina 98AG31]|uniref:Secreted protein n=1 Tax=Melampsora larici-populina (strain 98AG31 / pathotype 3-4-7) TaxID=747676 RepID=F4RQ82_MELLP|nr:uncharacterized protein MELLADRAFT_64159 [Melampsora larici-populina 98AG31]EGG05359.1 secreted protein [Melampsora larici-populina 98AG31]